MPALLTSSVPHRRRLIATTMAAATGTAIVTTACSGSDDETTDDVIRVDDGGCDLPVSFEVAADWTIESVGPDVAADFERGGYVPVCEVGGHDAGWIAFVRVWKGPGEDPGQALQDFVGDISGVQDGTRTNELVIDGVDAAETTYERVDAIDQRKPGRAFAVPHDDGMVIVSLTGFDAEEVDGAAPAYELARDTAQLVQG